MKISMITAMNKKRVIGFNNAMPWHLPADLQHFKQLTMGKPIIMGRKTFDSIGRALPGRDNVIITHNVHFKPPKTIVCHSIDHVIQQYQNQPEIMIIGGATIYQQFMPYTTTLYITTIEDNSDGDTFFPQWDTQQWKETHCVEHEPCAINPYRYAFITLKKITSI